MGHPACHPRWLLILFLDSYTDVAIKCFLYNMDIIKMRYIFFCIYSKLKLSFVKLSLYKIPFVYIRF